MKKYKIYSGAKPSSVDKTFAVYSGGKYFTTSSVKKVKLTVPFYATSYMSGNYLRTVMVNTENLDSCVVTPVAWYYQNDGYNDGALQTVAYPSGQEKTFGPNTSYSYSLDVSTGIKEGMNTIYADYRADPAYGCQTASAAKRTTGVTVYKKITAPSMAVLRSFSNPRVTGTVSGTEDWELGTAACRCRAKNLSPLSQFLYIKESTATSFPSVQDRTAPGGFATLEKSLTSAGTTTFQGYADCVNSSGTKTAAASNTVSAAATLYSPPVLSGVIATSKTSTTFNVVISNTNSEPLYCCAICQNVSNSEASQTYRVKCSANGKGALEDIDGRSKSFVMKRGDRYAMRFYFHKDPNKYEGTQYSQMLKVIYDVPASGYLYAKPKWVSNVYPTQSSIKFNIFNPNQKNFYCMISLYNGTGTSSRVDYWYHQVATRATAISTNSWPITKGNTYTLVAYFQESTGYYRTAVSESLTRTFVA